MINVDFMEFSNLDIVHNRNLIMTSNSNQFCDLISNQLPDFDFTATYFNFTKLCSKCCADSKTFRIALSAYDDGGCCNLTTEQKKDFSFV